MGCAMLIAVIAFGTIWYRNMGKCVNFLSCREHKIDNESCHLIQQGPVTCIFIDS